MKSTSSKKIRRGLFIFACFMAFSVTVYVLGNLRREQDISTPQQVLMRASQMIQYGNALAARMDEKDMSEKFRAAPKKACAQKCVYKTVANAAYGGRRTKAGEKWLVLPGLTPETCSAVANVDRAQKAAGCFADEAGVLTFVHWLKRPG